MTNATSWPWKTTRSPASTACTSSLSVGIHASSPRSAAVSTACTRGCCSAALTSIERISACAQGERRIAPCSIPGSWTSSRKRPRPRMKRASSLRRTEPYTSGLALGVEHGDVDRLAAPALDPHALGHRLRAHGGGEHVAALHAHVVVGPVGAEDRALGVVLQGGGAVGRHLALAHPAHDHPLGQIAASLVVKSLISAASTVCTMPSPIDAALTLSCALVSMEEPPSLSVNRTSSLASHDPPVSRD